MVRHGETLWNQQRIIQGGGSDIELSETGRWQARQLGLALKDTAITAVYTSPLKRAVETAESIASHHRLNVNIEQDLREMAVGKLEGVSIESLTTNFSQYLVDSHAKSEAGGFPGGESLEQLRQRVWSVIQRIEKHDKKGVAVVVSHYFVTVMIVCSALNIPSSHIVRIRVQPSSRTVIDFCDGAPPRLVTLSDTCHLRER